MSADKVLAVVTSVTIAAKIEGVSVRTMRRWADTGKVKATKPGGVYIIYVPSLPSQKEPNR